MKNWTKVILLVLIVSCGSKNQYDETELKEAYTVQQEILKSLPVIKDAMEVGNLASKDSLKDVIHEIEESLFEIPGYHLELPGHEGHDHSHERVELTSTEMVDVNKALLEQIKEIKAYLNINE